MAMLNPVNVHSLCCWSGKLCDGNTQLFAFYTASSVGLPIGMPLHGIGRNPQVGGGGITKRSAATTSTTQQQYQQANRHNSQQRQQLQSLKHVKERYNKRELNDASAPSHGECCIRPLYCFRKPLCRKRGAGFTHGATPGIIFRV